MMDMGLLWYDDTANRPLADKVAEAARRYREKFGMAPNTCYVNQSALKEQPMTLNVAPGLTLEVLPASNVLPSHFYVGVVSGI
jgi:hypothetical protein